MTNNKNVLNWIEEMKALVEPDKVVWIDGSEAQLKDLRDQALATGEMEALNPEKLPGCLLHRTAVNDVARVEGRTFICSRKKEDAGPTNNWEDPNVMYDKLRKLFDGAMRGRTMYVIPYCMGPIGSPFSKVGVELTDSIYVVLNMDIMTRMGQQAFDQLGETSNDFVRGLHSKAQMDEENRYIVQFPEDNTIWSVNSGYGGNVLLGKTCFALRIGPDGRLWANNPENGFFGVAPGTNMKSNPNALISTQKNTIFTNVVHNLDDNTVWWEGLDKNPPKNALNWKGEKWDCTDGSKGAHPNSRFTAPAINCPCISSEFNNPNGVPISAIIFGGRRAKTAPLVYQARDWQHGVFVGSTMASETTAAAAGAVGVVRRDPMAMLPFCGYNMGDYWAHWLEMGKKLGDKAPKIFNVNWFRTDDEGHFIWPGFGDNMRVLNWIVDRCEGKADAVETPIGYEPKPEDIDVEGLDITTDTVRDLLSVDKNLWKEEVKGIKEFYAKFGDKLPQALESELATLESNLNK